MKPVIGSHSRIGALSLVLSTAILVAGTAAAAQAHTNHSTPRDASAYSSMKLPAAIQLCEADSAPLGTDERDRTPGISHKEWLENKKIEKEKAKEKAAGAKSADTKTKDSNPADAKTTGDSKEAPADGKKALPLLRKDQDDPKTQAPTKPEVKPDKSQPSVNGKPEVLIKDEKKNKSESKSKAAPDNKASTEKPAERHRFGWQNRP